MKKLRIFVLLGVVAAGVGLALPASSASASTNARGPTQNDLPPCLPPNVRRVLGVFL